MIINEGGGGKKLPTLSNPGTAANLLTGKQLIDQNGNILAGTMPNNGNVSQALNAGTSYTIPAGYHAGGGKVTANSLSTQTSGTATAADIKSGKTAWVNGTKLTGTGQMLGSVNQFRVDYQGRDGYLDWVGTDQGGYSLRGETYIDVKGSIGSIVAVFTSWGGIREPDVIPTSYTGFELIDDYINSSSDFVCAVYLFKILDNSASIIRFDDE